MAKRILIVDDLPSVLLALQAGLEKAGYEVITASSGPSALRQFETYPADLIILDIAMPEMDGWEVYRHIRQSSTVPIIFLTGRQVSEADIRKGLEMGSNAYLVKPAPLENLIGCIKVALKE